MILLTKLMFFLGALQTEVSAQPNFDGWVAIERSEKEVLPLSADERDPSIWVVFSKEIGSEKILVRFPVEPTYKYLTKDGSEMELLAISGGNEHRVLIGKPSKDLLGERKANLEGAIAVHEKVGTENAELTYWKDGFWFMERLIATKDHSYILQTKSETIDSDSHLAFAASFDLQKK